jgi:formylglycine-generating enzyme required for sulfatase activity
MARIYVSSTFQDLERHREVVNHTLRQLGHVNVAMEDYVAADVRPLTKCLADVAGCDLYVGIFAWRYGHVPESFPAEAGAPPSGTEVGRTSITEFEYQKAVELEKPRLIFLAKVESGWPDDAQDRCTGENGAGARIDALRQVAGCDRLGDSFPCKPPEELGRILAVALPNWERTAPPPTTQAAEAALDHVRSALAANGENLEFTKTILDTVLRHRPRNLDEYRLGRVVEWAQPRYALDRRYTRMTLLRDQGEDATGGRWKPEPDEFHDLDEALAKIEDTALVVLGAPGSGKSTLLRHTELDAARRALQAGTEASPITFFASLSRFRPETPDSPLPDPRVWLGDQWRRRCPDLQEFEAQLATGRVALLLDGLNEIPQNRAAATGAWKQFLLDLDRDGRGNRVVIVCRSLDYSAPLSSNELPVPQLRLEPLSDPQVRDFLLCYAADTPTAIRLWEQLENTDQLELFRNPYYLKLWAQQVGLGGQIPAGRAALFTSFVREALRRELRAGHPLFTAGSLLHERDVQRLLLQQATWPTPYDLPSRGPLIGGLERLAHGMQARHAPGEGSQVRVGYDDAVSLTGLGEANEAASLLAAGSALAVLEQDLGRDDVAFLHQLLQEYFASRQVAAQQSTDTSLVALTWRHDEVTPALEDELRRLPASEPLPKVAQTGWEQTFLFAAEMSAAPDAFVTALSQVNLPLAGRCAAQPQVKLQRETQQRVAWSLVERNRDQSADLRARIAAAEALGELGDPRFEAKDGPFGGYLAPPLVTIEGGTYTIGSDEGIEADEAPGHPVSLQPLAIGQFPVTNAEWRCFMDAGSYDEERWWEGESAQAWRRGEGTAEVRRSDLQAWRSHFNEDSKRLDELVTSGRWTEVTADAWRPILALDDAAFDDWLKREVPGGRFRQPAQWGEEQFSGTNRPVVGVCWFEARAYCAWLSVQTGQLYRLPSEAEWEAAARGLEGRPWPWPGADFDTRRCNTFESHIRTTTPVGLFADGDTPEGISDLAGNVAEWTASSYRSYPTVPEESAAPDAGGRRVLRGGSWGSDRRNARCSYRYLDLLPDSRGSDIGFRVLCSSPIS